MQRVTFRSSAGRAHARPAWRALLPALAYQLLMRACAERAGPSRPLSPPAAGPPRCTAAASRRASRAIRRSCAYAQFLRFRAPCSRDPMLRALVTMRPRVWRFCGGSGMLERLEATKASSAGKLVSIFLVEPSLAVCCGVT